MSQRAQVRLMGSGLIAAAAKRRAKPTLQLREDAHHLPSLSETFCRELLLHLPSVGALRDRFGMSPIVDGDDALADPQLKPAMYIRGVDNIMLDMAARPEMARALFGRIRRFYSEYLERILGAAEGGIDIVLTGDDFGAQQGLLISPAMWDEFLREGFARYNAIVRSHGAVAMHHTCGSVVDLIPRMMDCGLQVLQSLQPEARGMEPGRLKASFGDRLSFQGGVSIQRTLPHGSPQDVRRHVGELAECMGAGGGYIFCTAHNIQADTPMSNIRALLDAYRDYGSPGSQ